MTKQIIIFTDCSSIGFVRYAGAYKLSTILRENGYSVQVIDHFIALGVDRVLNLIDKFVGKDTLMVGFTSSLMNIFNFHYELEKENPIRYKFNPPSSLKLFQGGHSMKGCFYGSLPVSTEAMRMIRDRIKSINPNTKLVLGGGKADYKVQQYVDTFIIGYAENSLLEYLRYLQDKNPFFQYKMEDDKMVIDHDINAEGYNFQESYIDFYPEDLVKPGEVLPLEISRGCIFKCKFCTFRMIGKKKNDYVKNTEVIYRELMSNYEKYKTTKYIITDDTFNESVDKLEKFYNMTLKLPFSLEYVCYGRHDLIHAFPEMADLLKYSGLKGIFFGIETLNYNTGKLIGKGLHPEKTKELLYWLKENKKWDNEILIHSSFLIGLPNETRESIRAWAKELENYPLDSALFNALSITPGKSYNLGSEFENNYEKYGYRFDPSKSSGWINDHWQVEDAVELASEILSNLRSTRRFRVDPFMAFLQLARGYEWKDIWSKYAGEFGQDYSVVLDDTALYYEKLLEL